MKPVRYSKHALRARRFWLVSAAEVLSTMSRPEKTETSPGGTVSATRRQGRRFLRVTYKEEPAHLFVLSVMPRMRG